MMFLSPLQARLPGPVAPPFGRVLVAKTTHLGDLVISLPMANAIKRRDPTCTVIFLTHQNNVDIANACPAIDEVYGEPASEHDLQNLLAALRIDIFIQVNCSKTLAKAAYAARIPVRIGSIFRPYNLQLCTHPVAISRANRNLNKRQLDLEYLLPLGIKINSLDAISALYHLIPEKSVMAPPGPDPIPLPRGRHKIILSPLLITARTHEWPLESYSKLIRLLDKDKFQWYICGVPSDRDRLQPLLERHAGETHVTDLVGRFNLAQFAGFIASCDLLVAGSTGPLHLAAALGIPIVGLFQSNKRDIHRWRPVGRFSTILYSDVSCPREFPVKYRRRQDCFRCPCILAIQPETVAQKITELVLTSSVEASVSSARGPLPAPCGSGA